MTDVLHVFETSNLRVRHWIDADFDDLLKVYGNPKAMKWVGDGQVLTVDGAKKWFEVTYANYEKRGYGIFAILDRVSAEVIGFGGIGHPNNQIEPEVKYTFLENVWGRGYATEFVVGLVHYARTQLKLGVLTATTYPENQASQRVLTKAGFVFEKEIDNDDKTKTTVFKLK